MYLDFYSNVFPGTFCHAQEFQRVKKKRRVLLPNQLYLRALTHVSISHVIYKLAHLYERCSLSRYIFIHVSVLFIFWGFLSHLLTGVTTGEEEGAIYKLVRFYERCSLSSYFLYVSRFWFICWNFLSLEEEVVVIIIIFIASQSNWRETEPVTCKLIWASRNLMAYCSRRDRLIATNRKFVVAESDDVFCY